MQFLITNPTSAVTSQISHEAFSSYQLALSYLKCHRVGITPLLYDLAAFLFRQRDAHSMQHLFQAFPCDHTLAIRARALSKVTLVSCSDFTSGWCNRLHTADAEKNSKTRFKE